MPLRLVFVLMIAASALLVGFALFWSQRDGSAALVAAVEAGRPSAAAVETAGSSTSDAATSPVLEGAMEEPIAADTLPSAAAAEAPPKNSTAAAEANDGPPPPASKVVPLPEDIWKPAATPKGGVPWSLLESTKELTRLVDGIIYSRPEFPPDVRALAGKRVRVAGYMMPLESSPKQSHFALMAYPPGCPFHFHALPNQFIEVYADEPVPLDEAGVTVVSGVLELIGQDEKGIFYRMKKAKAE